MDLKAYIPEIPDFPKPGVSFKDITPVFSNHEALTYTVQTLADGFRPERPDVVVGIESRGFLVGAPLAYELGIGFVVVRKEGKLPRATLREEYELEYGTNTLEIHRDAVAPGQRVLIADDLLATGGTVEATVRLVRRLGGIVVGCGFVVELEYLRGRERLRERLSEGLGKVVSLVRYA